MCVDPFTLLAIGGTVLSAGGALMEGQQQKQMADMQAKAYEQQAASDQQASSYEQGLERHKQELLTSQARAQIGASGVAAAGSPTEVLAANARQNELDVKAIQFGSQLRQNGLNTQAAISRYTGKQQQTASIFKAGSAAISGVSNLYDPSKSFRLGRSALGA